MKKDDIWAKLGAMFGLGVLLVTYIGTASQLHWFPFRANKLGSQSPRLSSATQKSNLSLRQNRGASPSPTFGSQGATYVSSLETGQHFLINDATGDCLDQDYGGGTPHADVLAYPCTYGNNELWNVTLNSNGSYSLTNVESGDCLGQDYVGGTPRLEVVAHSCDAKTNQNWRPIQIHGSARSYLANQESQGCLDQDYGDGVPHEDVLTWSPCNFFANEGWAER
jgi:hypothetical protein